MAQDMLKKIFISLYCFFCLTYLHAQEEVRVGIYENAPKIFIDATGNPSGFFVDILNEIALQEKWHINYIPCTWSECLNMLEEGTIDIMPDVAYSIDREKRFLFSQEAVISSWSVLYKHKDVKIDSLFTLKDKKIAIVKDSIQSDAIKKLLNSFNIQPQDYQEVLNFSEAFERLDKQEVDSVIANRFYELTHTLGTNVVKTNIVVEASMLKYAFSSSKKNLADRVDFYLAGFKKNKSSVFYTAEKKWLTPKASTNIPTWLTWSIAGGIILIFILILLVIIFQKMVTKKTKELLQKEELMIMQSKHAAMGEMIGMIAHQWRQPLSVISMSANNIRLSLELEEDLTPQTILQHLQTVSNQVQHLSNTVDDFRNFFKPDKKMIKMNISQLIDQANRLLASSLKDNNIELVIQNNDDYKIETFGNELLQVILNLVNNAKDVLKQKQIENAKITLVTSQTPESYTISITDNGGGIPENILNKIGKQYFTTKADTGTGLGLYMSITIIEQHLKGSLKWKNTVDGACFTISVFK